MDPRDHGLRGYTENQGLPYTMGAHRVLKDGYLLPLCRRLYPAQPCCPLSLHFLFNDIAQYQKSYWPNTYPNSQPLCMSFL